MPGTQLNIFENGDVTPTSLSSMQQTLLQTIQKLDNVMLLNYDSGTACLGIRKGSVVTVNYVAYKFLADELFNVLNADGTVSTANSVADGNYYIIFKPDSDGTCTGYLRAIASANVIEDTDKGAIYENYTQHRIIGGLTKSGTSFYNKWRYELKCFNLEKPGSWLIRYYADGVELNPRKLAPRLYTQGVNASVPVNWSAAGLGTTATDVAWLDITYPCYVNIAWAWSGGSAPSGYKTTTPPSGYLQLILTNGGGADVMAVSTTSPILPGIYKIRVCTTAGTANDTRSHSKTLTNSVAVYSYSILNPFGTRIGL